ncbi:MAG: hypothetical protein QXQ50_02160 [Candidatus Bathyarchaeia archaeon]
MTKKSKPHIWVSGDKFLVVTPDWVWKAKTGDVKSLLEGKIDKVSIEKIRKDTIILMKTKTRIYSFIYPQKRLTEEQIKSLENMGFIPVQRELGETTRLVGVRLDTRNLNNLRIIQARLKQQGKELTLTAVHRLALIKGIEQLMKETQPS